MARRSAVKSTVTPAGSDTSATRSFGASFWTNSPAASIAPLPPPRVMLPESTTSTNIRPGGDLVFELYSARIITRSSCRRLGICVRSGAVANRSKWDMNPTEATRLGLPSTVTVKSSALSSGMGRPSLSTTSTSTVTRSTPDRNTGCWVAGWV